MPTKTQKDEIQEEVKAEVQSDAKISTQASKETSAQGCNEDLAILNKVLKKLAKGKFDSKDIILNNPELKETVEYVNEIKNQMNTLEKDTSKVSKGFELGKFDLRVQTLKI